MEHRFYAIQTTAGHENKVRLLIERRIVDDPRPEEERLIRQALVPTQQVVEIKNGKKVTVERKEYPGYVLVEMVLNQDTMHTINGIQGVIKFVGQGWTPQPLRQDEVMPACFSIRARNFRIADAARLFNWSPAWLDADCHSDMALARACCLIVSMLLAPMPRGGRFTTRSNEPSSSRFAINRR